MNYLLIGIFKLLIETLGGEVNARDNYDRTLLHAGGLDFNLAIFDAIICCLGQTGR